MASATRVDGIVAFANAGENLQPAATAPVEARPQGSADARPALAADRCACWAPALSIEPWMSPAGRATVAFARVAVVAGRVAGAFVGTRCGAGGVGSASSAICAPSAAAGRLGCSIGGLLGGLLLVSAPGAACMALFFDRCGCCYSLVGRSCHKIERAASVATTEPVLGPEARPAPAAHSGPKPLSEASEACKEELRSNDHSFGASFLTRSCLSYSSSARGERVPNITEEAAPTRPRREAEGLWAAQDRCQYFH